MRALLTLALNTNSNYVAFLEKKIRKKSGSTLFNVWAPPLVHFWMFLCISVKNEIFVRKPHLAHLCMQVRFKPFGTYVEYILASLRLPIHICLIHYFYVLFRYDFLPTLVLIWRIFYEICCKLIWLSVTGIWRMVSMTSKATSGMPLQIG